MNNVTQIVQKVRQAPWRVQRQWIGLFLLGLVATAMVAGIFLNVAVRTTVAGREIQTLRNDITTNERLNADLGTQLAGLTAIAAMQQRAEDMGFKVATLEDVTYVAVPGYEPRPAIDLSTPGAKRPTGLVILPEYTESWFEHFMNQQTTSSSVGGQP